MHTWSIAYSSSPALLRRHRTVEVSNTEALLDIAREHTNLPLEVEDYTDQVDIFTRGSDERKRKLVTFFYEGRSPEHVFVYGTLKRGYWNSRLMAKCGGEFVTTATTVDPFFLKDGGFPYAFKNADQRLYPVSGEVWRINPQVLKRLDQLEGVPTHYQRLVVRVVAKNAELDAYMYVVTDRQGHGHACPVNAEGNYEWNSPDRRESPWSQSA